ncbi:immunity 22 family protein [Cytobacillus gottheilii]|uniref:immunity 22 family protein n=1 Tax=Cytobacillus gottheilii TaxID=859144 RepID=UPI000836661B|nr:immunity 22 family protein [Cytobacillus gottheilii]
MQSNSAVSIWFGVSNSLHDLEEYVEVTYTEDGDSIDSSFGTSFGFGYFDEDKIEIHFFEEPLSDLDEILKDFSYSESFIPSLKSVIQSDHLAHKINSVILLYDLEDDILSSEDTTGNIEMKYIATVPYIED